ncbi:UNVERIFIED_CONTAM: hypothetical protein PYX00_008439 [Menopon gallinae]|uniref:Chitobiosyldiphosphodolichol beta-mannosyltransferase n=1 Tax=Menopon gallinae TaxID=328185 RepID=A0AAW2HN01_9NEOP
MSTNNKGRICIVVVGDIGRSPRMQYHALSMLEEGYDVEIIGYQGSQPVEKLRTSNNVKFNYIYSCPEFKNFLPNVLAHFVKVLWQIITIFIALLISNHPDYVLVQNPPAVPVLGVCFIFCKVFKSKFVIDWHNYAYTILSLSLGEKHLLVRISKWFEFYFGRKSDANICVTKAMKKDLMENHGINAVVFYDRPPDFFKETTVEQKHLLFSKLGIEYDVFVNGCEKNETVFTRRLPDSTIVLREERPAFVVSSTSWTEDEDFSVLLSALEEYENAKSASEPLPSLICAITGKGPLKEFYSDIIRRKNWKHVTVITPWLEANDYPTFLGSADLGICLHKSSSGLDLPMKVVDMFGCSVPVCAITFECLPELVEHKENGFIFSDSEELFENMKYLLFRFPEGRLTVFRGLKKNIEKFRSL